MAHSGTEQDTRSQEALAHVLLEANRALPRHRMRTRRSVCTQALAFWRDRWGDAPADQAGLDTLSDALEQLAAAGHVTVGGPSRKRVQLNSRGKEYLARVLHLT